VLLALVTKRQGGQLLQALLPELLRLASEGPTQADMVHSLFCIACKMTVILYNQASSTARVGLPISSNDGGGSSSSSNTDSALAPTFVDGLLLLTRTL